MANLSLSQDAIRASGSPLLVAALQQLVDPFRSGNALASALRQHGDDRTAAGLDAGTFAMRAATLLQPPPTPDWQHVLSAAAALTDVAWPGAGTDGALVAAALGARWRQQLRLPGGTPPSWEALRGAVRRDVATCTNALLCAAVLAPGDSNEGAQARGALLDRMDAGALDGWDAALALECGLLAGLGPRDRFNKRAREYLAALPDPATGLWPTALGPAAQAETTWWAVLLLMRGG